MTGVIAQIDAAAHALAVIAVVAPIAVLGCVALIWLVQWGLRS